MSMTPKRVPQVRSPPAQNTVDAIKHAAVKQTTQRHSVPPDRSTLRNIAAESCHDRAMNIL